MLNLGDDKLVDAVGIVREISAKQAAKGTEFSKGEIYKELISGKES